MRFRLHQRHEKKDMGASISAGCPVDEESKGEALVTGEASKKPPLHCSAPASPSRPCPNRAWRRSKSKTGAVEESTAENRTSSLGRSPRAAQRRGVGKAVGNFFRGLEAQMFPTHPLAAEHNTGPTTLRKKRQTTYLHGCDTLEAHLECIQVAAEVANTMSGNEGLRALGFEFRLCPCHLHETIETEDDEQDVVTKDVFSESKVYYKDESASQPSLVTTEDIQSTACTVASQPDLENLGGGEEAEQCHYCQSRLVHIASDTVVDEENRAMFIANGHMYECISKLCMEHAHHTMCTEGNLRWEAVQDDVGAMVSEHALSGNVPTLLVATGRGKVRGGIFSRQNLFCSGLECSTALPVIREARKRNLQIIVVDPNVNGEAHGFDVISMTLDLFFRTEAPLYVLSHSASGGHIARYLLDRDHLLPRVRGIAFTDSTHNIQWAIPKVEPSGPSSLRRHTSAASVVQKATRNEEELSTPPTPLYGFLESHRCVYFRSSKVRCLPGVRAAGTVSPTDSFWHHRFGKIRTLWAGTAEHSMTNWHAHFPIWEHFDRLLAHEQTS